MPDELNIKEVSDFLKLPEPMRWQVLFFGLVGVKRQARRIEFLGWSILASVLTSIVLGKI